MDIVQRISASLSIQKHQVGAAVELLKSGNTVPFIARYRKEVTGGLDDTQLRDLEERLTYFEALQSRQETILSSIESQGKLTPELKAAILSTDSKTHLEDLYLPYKPKRRTKAEIAKEAGLEPLADVLLSDYHADPEVVAEKYLNPEKNVSDVKAALEGARFILMDRFSQDADLLKDLRDFLYTRGKMFSTLVKDKAEEAAKFSDYFEFEESLSKMPSHRILALFRGRKEGFLSLRIDFDTPELLDTACAKIARAFNITLSPKPDHWLWQTVVWTWKVKLHTKLEVELMTELKTRADDEAIDVFRGNLRELLMMAPAGNHVVLGLDPGYRTGVKTVVVDGTGKLLSHTVIYPHAPQKKWDEALAKLRALCEHFSVTLISIGNGTASRETDQLVVELLKKCPKQSIQKVVISEAGASVYSASALAAKEFPELDVSYRGAVSIARRLQDPLAELVKIDPKSIGVGQYQHDVNAVKLERSLNATVEDCVNAVGADVNTASVPLLTSIAGLNESIANQIVQYREAHGRFSDREAIKKVPRLGEKTFEQAAGFLRILAGSNPLDRSAVHPERYAVVAQMANAAGVPVETLIGNTAAVDQLDPKQFISDTVGLPTIRDILSELKKPGRDPRPEFKTVAFKEGVHEIKDLAVGMELDGVVTNVANFGAFVDVGVHQDGLVHVSEIANHFVESIHDEVKVGQIVRVTVLEVDQARKRISLSMKQAEKKSATPKRKKAPQKSSQSTMQAPEGALADKLKKAFQKSS